MPSYPETARIEELPYDGGTGQVADARFPNLELRAFFKPSTCSLNLSSMQNFLLIHWLADAALYAEACSKLLIVSLATRMTDCSGNCIGCECITSVSALTLRDSGLKLSLAGRKHPYRRMVIWLLRIR